MSDQPYSFEQLQRWMQNVIMHPGGVEFGAASDAARQYVCVEQDELESVIAPSQALSGAQRLEIYAQAYYARLIECLRAEYAMLLRAIGEELFDQFAVDFLQRYPSTSYTLSDLGARFPDYLRETRPTSGGDDTSNENAWPDFLIDLAALERTYAEVFDGPGVEDVEPITASALAEVLPDQWGSTRLTPAPCLRLMTLDYPVHRYYRQLRKNEEAIPPAPQTTHLAITRRDYTVRPLDVELNEHELLASLIGGDSLGDAITHAATQFEDLEQLAAKLPIWFQRWMAERFFIAIELE
jgi:hypothetical protein